MSEHFIEQKDVRRPVGRPSQIGTRHNFPSASERGGSGVNARFAADTHRAAYVFCLRSRQSSRCSFVKLS